MAQHYITERVAGEYSDEVEIIAEVYRDDGIPNYRVHIHAGWMELGRLHDAVERIAEDAYIYVDNNYVRWLHDDEAERRVEHTYEEV